MSETPNKTPRRHRQKQRNTDLPQGAINSLAEELSSRQTKSDFDLPETNGKTTSSPQPTVALIDSDHADHGKVNRPKGDMTKGKQIKQTPRKKPVGGQGGASPTPKHNSTPRPNSRPKSMTPVKQPATSSQQYYAGPTFHASPAASSLPMPRWFSKSVPKVNEETGDQLATKDTSETSSDQSEESPTPSFAQRMGEQHTREESPLDVLFKADREEKSRQRKNQELGSHDENLLTPRHDLDRPRHHSRHSTGGSLGALFPMELENKEFAEPFPSKTSEIDQGETNATVSNGMSSAEVMETPQQLEQRKAKTLALKKLLLSSIPAAPTDSTPTSKSDVHINDSNSNPLSFQQPKRAAGSPMHKQFAVQTARQVSPCPRPSSNLRKELSASALTENGPIPELPATPTPSRTRNGQTALSHETHPVSPFGHKSQSEHAQNITPRSSPAPEMAHASSPYKKMEDDLRRILKMDNLPSEGATSVRS
ncbi:MAG: hypothetical protein Q9218_005896 [Villophora microphyllina]